MIKKVIIKTSLIVFLVIFITSCSKQPSCVTADVLQPIPSQELSKSGKSIYLRTSGMSDKVSFYELYDSNPTFDECGVSDINPVAGAVVDEALGAPSRLLVTAEGLNLEYAAMETGTDNLLNIEIVVEGRDSE